MITYTSQYQTQFGEFSNLCQLELAPGNRWIQLGAFFQPRKLTQNNYVKRLIGSIRSELLNAYIFKTLIEVREKTQQWKYEHKHNRPHK